MTLELLATGDLMVEHPPAMEGGFGEVANILRSADGVFANLEVPLTNHHAPADKLVRFRSDPALARELTGWGVDVVSVANNHACDHGIEGMLDTTEALREAGVDAVGAGLDLEAALRPQIRVHGGVRVAFLALASTLPNGCGAAPDRPGIAPVRVLSRFVVDPVTIDEEPGISPLVETKAMDQDVAAATDAVRAAREISDIVVVACHWGVPHGWVAPYQGELATYQQPLAHALIDAGADAVAGHHPHVLHGVEMYEGRPIFYSLGNFLFHAFASGDPRMGRPEPRYSWDSLRGEANRYGGIAHLTWDGAREPPRVELLPVRLDERGEPALAKGDAAGWALERIEMLSREFRGTHVERRQESEIALTRIYEEGIA